MEHQERDRTPFELHIIDSTKLRSSFICQRVNNTLSNMVDSPKIKKRLIIQSKLFE